ncbi:Mitochondrial outer membrane protein porin [Diplodia seriata]|uniref:Mitochondrial outer membrane protein porin n=1 Tax=Diplodia seriata TaxID=420778 RepID=A0A1S8B7X3_9PEZI|nr:Mitochondrial outer membrane protein porin [Diplodia seriata]
MGEKLPPRREFPLKRVKKICSQLRGVGFALFTRRGPYAKLFTSPDTEGSEQCASTWEQSILAVLEVKLKSPNGVAVTTKGTSAHDGPINGSVRLSGLIRISTKTGITVTESWNTANVLNTKVELDNTFTKGLKAELSSVFAPSSGNKGQKLNLTFKQPAFQTRAFFDYSAAGNLTAVVDGVVGHEGFLVGGEAGYDVQKAAITRYSAAVGYQTPLYSAAVTATNNLNVFTASYYQKVNAAVETGAKASWDAKSGSAVGIELASKYKLDPLSFAKAKINDRGIASLAYNTKINQGFTFGIGASLDAQKLNEAGHKVSYSFASKWGSSMR